MLFSNCSQNIIPVAVTRRLFQNLSSLVTTKHLRFLASFILWSVFIWPSANFNLPHVITVYVFIFFFYPSVVSSPVGILEAFWLSKVNDIDCSCRENGDKEKRRGSSGTCQGWTAGRCEIWGTVSQYSTDFSRQGRASCWKHLSKNVRRSHILLDLILQD